MLVLEVLEEHGGGAVYSAGDAGGRRWQKKLSELPGRQMERDGLDFDADCRIVGDAAQGGVSVDGGSRIVWERRFVECGSGRKSMERRLSGRGKCLMRVRGNG